jgi:DHA1 family tetracycline resistance protein-like MFS transporter
VGLSLSLVGIMAAIVQAGLAGRILAAIGERAGVYVEYAVMSVIMVCYGLATHGWMIYALIIVGSINNIGNPAAQALISKAVPPDQQGAVQGAMTSVTSIANIVAPPIWGLLFPWSLSLKHTPFPGLSFVIAGGVMLFALLLAWRTFGKHPPMEQVTSPEPTA